MYEGTGVFRGGHWAMAPSQNFLAPKCRLKRHRTRSWQIQLGTDRPTQGYADSFPCPEFDIPNVFLTKMYSCILHVIVACDAVSLMASCSLLVFMQKIIFTVKKIHKIVRSRAALFGSDINQSLGSWDFAPDPTGGAYSTPPDLEAVFRGPTSKGRNGGNRRGKKSGRKKEKDEKEGHLSR